MFMFTNRTSGTICHGIGQLIFEDLPFPVCFSSSYDAHNLASVSQREYSLTSMSFSNRF